MSPGPRQPAPLSQARRSLGLAVRHFRTELGVSQEELAFRCGLHRNYVGDVERGERNPSLESIAKLAAGLGVSLSALFDQADRSRRS